MKWCWTVKSNGEAVNIWFHINTILDEISTASFLPDRDKSQSELIRAIEEKVNNKDDKTVVRFSDKYAVFHFTCSKSNAASKSGINKICALCNALNTTASCDQFQVTVVPESTEAKMRLSKTVDDKINRRTYESADGRTIYIVELRPGRRLLACIDEFSQDDIEVFIKTVIDNYSAQFSLDLSDALGETSNFINEIEVFMPDNIYVDNDKKLHFNKNVPNHPGLNINEDNTMKLLVDCMSATFISAIIPNRECLILSRFLNALNRFIWCLLTKNSSTLKMTTSLTETTNWLNTGKDRKIPQYYIDILFTNLQFSSLQIVNSTWIDIQTILNSETWLQQKSNDLHEDFIVEIKSSCQKKECLIVDFTKDYKIFFHTVNEATNSVDNCRYQIICFPNSKKERTRLYAEKIFHKMTKIYHSNDQSTIYMMEKLPQKRLIDHLEDYDWNQIMSLIEQILKYFSCQDSKQVPKLDQGKYFSIFSKDFNLLKSELWYSANIKKYYCLNFRPDNVFIDENNLLCINRCISNSCDLPFLLKDNKAVTPFHLRSQYSKFQYEEEEEEEKDEEEEETQLMFSLGWFIWILIEGTGSCRPNTDQQNPDEWIEQLQFGRFPDYPKYLGNIILSCWKHQFPLDEFSEFLDWIDREFCSSKAVPTDLREIVLNNLNGDTLLVDFCEHLKIYGLRYKEEEIQVTVLLKLEDINYAEKKESIMNLYDDGDEYYDNDDDEEEKLRHNLQKSRHFQFQSDDRSSFYVINYLSHKRLIDNLDDLSFHQIEKIIRQVAENDWEFRVNFRPDNIYLDNDNVAYLNPNIESDISTPLFIFKDGKTAQPFFVKSMHSGDDDSKEFIYRFGWFVWVVIRGLGIPPEIPLADVQQEKETNWLSYLKTTGRFPDYPGYFNDVMTLCWNVYNVEQAKKSNLSKCLLFQSLPEETHHYHEGDRIWLAVLKTMGIETKFDEI